MMLSDEHKEPQSRVFTGAICFKTPYAYRMRIVVGIILVVLGLLGLILPIMPGWVFLIPGLILLSTKFTWARRLLERLRPPRRAGDDPRKPQS